jgi:hypothetical protein
VIIVSGPSAKAAQRVRTGRYTPVGCRSSAARSGIPRYSDAQPISVHTEEVTGSIPVLPTSPNTATGQDLQGCKEYLGSI